MSQGSLFTSPSSAREREKESKGRVVASGGSEPDVLLVAGPSGDEHNPRDEESGAVSTRGSSASSVAVLLIAVAAHLAGR